MQKPKILVTVPDPCNITTHPLTKNINKSYPIREPAGTSLRVHSSEPPPADSPGSTKETVKKEIQKSFSFGKIEENLDKHKHIQKGKELKC